MTSSLPSSGSEDGGDSYGRISFSDLTGGSYGAGVPDSEDQFLAEVAEPSPERSLPPIIEQLYSDAAADPLPPSARRRKHATKGAAEDGAANGDGHAEKTGEMSTSDKEVVAVERPRPKGTKRPPLVPGEEPKRRRIRVAPLRIPLKRRLQTAAVLLHEFTIPLYISLFWFLLAIPLTWPVLVPYLLYCLFSNAHVDGSSPRRRSRFLRSLPLWRLYTGYFPLRLHKSCDLDPARNYILTYHPHGIISHGAFGHFCTEGTTGFESLFPGLTNTLLTLDSNFRVPFYRDYLLSMGLASVSRRSCEALLRGEAARAPPAFALWRPWTWWRLVQLLFHPAPTPAAPPGGRAITIVLGGAVESLEAIPGRMALIVRRRRGVLKIAIRENAGLVPALSFGENSLYDQHVPRRASWVSRAQRAVKRVAGFTVPLFHARGVFNYDVGLMPYRREVNTVVGRPVFPAAQVPEPRDADVDLLQERYMAELRRLWDAYKDVYALDRTPGAEGELRFVG